MSDDGLPSVIPVVSEADYAAILIWALFHASGGTATRMDLASAFALRARPALLKEVADRVERFEHAQEQTSFSWGASWGAT